MFRKARNVRHFVFPGVATSAIGEAALRVGAGATASASSTLAAYPEFGQ
jgi:hypothetical protein